VYRVPNCVALLCRPLARHNARNGRVRLTCQVDPVGGNEAEHRVGLAVDPVTVAHLSTQRISGGRHVVHLHNAGAERVVDRCVAVRVRIQQMALAGRQQGVHHVHMPQCHLGMLNRGRGRGGGGGKCCGQRAGGGSWHLWQQLNCLLRGRRVGCATATSLQSGCATPRRTTRPLTCVISGVRPRLSRALMSTCGLLSRAAHDKGVLAT
jgi:hypothetical protein